MAERTALNRRCRAALPDNAVSLAWSPDGKRIAAATASGPVALIDPSSGQVAHLLPGHSLGTAAVSWKHDGSLLATAGLDGKARLWDGTREAGVLDAGAAWAEHALWHPSLDVLATAAGKHLRLWCSSGELLRDYPPHPSTIAVLAWRPRTDELASGCYGGVKLWKTDSDEPSAGAEWKGSVLSFAWRPDGAALAHGDQGGTAHLWNVAKGDHLEMAGYPLKVRNVAWDGSGRLLATDGSEIVLVWDCKPPGPSGTRPLELKGHAAPVSALAYHPRAALLASGGEDGKVLLWQPGVFRKSVATSEAGAAVGPMRWSPDGRLLAVANEAAGLSVYSII